MLRDWVEILEGPVRVWDLAREGHTEQGGVCRTSRGKNAPGSWQSHVATDFFSGPRVSLGPGSWLPVHLHCCPETQVTTLKMPQSIWPHTFWSLSLSQSTNDCRDAHPGPTPVSLSIRRPGFQPQHLHSFSLGFGGFGTCIAT